MSLIISPGTTTSVKVRMAEDPKGTANVTFTERNLNKILITPIKTLTFDSSNWNIDQNLNVLGLNTLEEGNLPTIYYDILMSWGGIRSGQFDLQVVISGTTINNADSYIGSQHRAGINNNPIYYSRLGTIITDPEKTGRIIPVFSSNGYGRVINLVFMYNGTSIGSSSVGGGGNDTEGSVTALTRSNASMEIAVYGFISGGTLANYISDPQYKSEGTGTFFLSFWHEQDQAYTGTTTPHNSDALITVNTQGKVGCYNNVDGTTAFNYSGPVYSTNGPYPEDYFEELTNITLEDADKVVNGALSTNTPSIQEGVLQRQFVNGNPVHTYAEGTKSGEIDNSLSMTSRVDLSLGGPYGTAPDSASQVVTLQAELSYPPYFREDYPLNVGITPSSIAVSAATTHQISMDF